MEATAGSRIDAKRYGKGLFLFVIEITVKTPG